MKYGAPGEIRTPDHLVRSQVLYPAELRARREARDYPLALAKVQVYEGSAGIKKAPRRGLMCVAESEGFEPSMGVNPYALSRGAPSATRPALQNLYARSSAVCSALRLSACQGRALFVAALLTPSGSPFRRSLRRLRLLRVSHSASSPKLVCEVSVARNQPSAQARHNTTMAVKSKS